MNRRQLEHLLRAAGSISGQDRVIVIGSQSILGARPDAPASLLMSMAAALAAHFAPEAIASIVVPEEGLNSDIHAQADHRAHLMTVMAMRAVEAAAT